MKQPEIKEPPSSSEKQYIIKKASRWIASEMATAHEGYRGASCQDAGIQQGHVYDDLEDALGDVEKLTDVNPVGFRVWEVGAYEPIA